MCFYSFVVVVVVLVALSLVAEDLFADQVIILEFRNTASNDT